MCSKFDGRTPDRQFDAFGHTYGIFAEPHGLVLVRTPYSCWKWEVIETYDYEFGGDRDLDTLEAEVLESEALDIGIDDTLWNGADVLGLDCSIPQSLIEYEW